ncbi:GNAT family N-acetyltransferase [uncultured Pseudoteredinibacter sp.]|uniref:GNAT family N-acetyltransferase n=1 Tax=uncultured Pseudoteredinibacter sp. TaxID=1641701 RepID=UPI002616BA1C|nr:GNAT family N-acetyltransferase [uncultured Pseudoteredinibacter sp.]
MDIEFSQDKSRLDVSKIHSFLCMESSWAKGIPLETVHTAIDNSLCFAAFENGEQIAFCRVISDMATFANLVDVIVWPDYRGQGLAAALLERVIEHPSLKQVRRFTLATSNAHGLYKKLGFTPLSKPDTFMERYRADIYSRL